MDQLIYNFQQIEIQYQQATQTGEYEKRYELIEQAREVYNKASYCDRKTLLYAFPKWRLVLSPNLV
jgi:cell fate (sporulation/competence/biofilm development) regulator YlbF (YheA/YmcA/DUF963 family)